MPSSFRENSRALKLMISFPFLKFVDLLQHRDGDHHVVLLEGVDAVVIVEDDVGVQHEYLVRPGKQRMGAKKLLMWTCA